MRAIARRPWTRARTVDSREISILNLRLTSLKMQRRASRQRTRASGRERATMSQVPPGPGASGPAKPVNVIVFPGGFNWPIWVAQERGLFAARGIEVAVTETPG